VDAEVRSYHYRINCQRLLVARWHGASVRVSDEPPLDAHDPSSLLAWLRTTLVGAAPEWPPREAWHGQERFLCGMCDIFVPRSVPEDDLDPTEERCAACGDARLSHDFDWQGGPCGAAAAWELIGAVGWERCPCDGYQPPGTAPLVLETERSIPTHTPCLYLRREQPTLLHPKTIDVPGPVTVSVRPSPSVRPAGCVSDAHATSWYERPSGGRNCAVCHPAESRKQADS
jgi:hypothetical protein